MYLLLNTEDFPLPSDIAMAVGHEALLGRCLAAAGSTECTQGLQQSSVSAELRSVLVGTASSEPTGGGLDVNFRVRMSENWDSSPKPADWSKKRGESYQMIHSETTYGCPIDNCVVVCCFWDLWDFHPRLNPHIDHSKKHTHTPSLATPVNEWDWFEVWPRACWAHFFWWKFHLYMDRRKGLEVLYTQSVWVYKHNVYRWHHRTKCHVVAIKYPNTIEIHLSVNVGMPFNHKHEIMRCIWAYAAVSNHVQSALTTRT